MDVLIVIPAMSPEAGAEQSLFAVSPHLLSSGFALRYALLTPHQGLAPGLLEMGIPVHDLSGLGSWGQVRELRRIIRESQPDLVHATLFQASLPAQLASIGLRRRLLVTWANTPVDPRAEGLTPWKMALVRFTDSALGTLTRTRYHAVTQGVALSKSRELHVPLSRVRVAERGRDATRFVGLDPTVRRRAREELGLGDDDVAFLALGRQEPQKGYPDLIRAFDEVAGRWPAARLLIAGRTGSATSAIERSVTQMEHPERLHLLGHRDDVPELLEAAEVVVCASHREGAAGSLIEAMASGTPIVSVELEGMVGILENDRNAIVVKRHDLVRGMETVLADPPRAEELGEAARATFLERFTIERSADALADVYRWAATS